MAIFLYPDSARVNGPEGRVNGPEAAPLGFRDGGAQGPGGWFHAGSHLLWRVRNAVVWATDVMDRRVTSLRLAPSPVLEAVKLKAAGSGVRPRPPHAMLPQHR